MKNKNLLNRFYTIYPEDPNSPDGVRQYFQRIIDVLPNNVYWLDRNCMTLGCNHNVLKLIGLDSLQEFVGINYDEMGRLANWKEGQAKSFKRDDMEVMSTGIPKLNVEEPPIYDKQGNLTYYLSSRVPLFNDNNKVIGVVGISVDITERKKSELALIEANKAAEAANQAKTAFLENIRHDIRTPLSGITGLSRLILEEATDPIIREYANDLMLSSETLLSLLNDVLEATNIASGELPKVRKKFNLKEKLEEIITLNKTKAREKGVELKFTYDKKLPNYLFGDAQRLQRIILELLTNGLNFTARGHVKVTANLVRKEKDRNRVIKITVEDTGVGIQEEQQQSIFLRFKRLTPSYEGIYKGLGLGLAIVKQFIDELDGEIYVDSRAGKGSIFTCLFSIQEALTDDVFGADTTPLETSAAQFHRMNKVHCDIHQQLVARQSHILVVEDQSIAATITKKLLEALGCHVTIAETGKKAVEKALENDYDLILMDVGLPDIDGCQSTQKIRASKPRDQQHLPIIGLTAHVEAEQKKQCITSGMDAVLTKPLAKKTALDILKAFIPDYAKVEYLADQSPRQSDIIGNPINFKQGIAVLGGDENVLKEMITLLIKGFPEALDNLKKSYSNDDWEAIKSICHKLRGEASYCGTPRLKKVCELLALAIDNNDKENKAPLYQKLLEEMSLISKASKSFL